MKSLAAAVIIGLIFAPAANADNYDRAATALCADLSQNPTTAQLHYDLKILVSLGLSIDQAAEFAVLAVSEYCPENMPVLRAYASAGQRSA